MASLYITAIHFIADDKGAFVGALGMLFDASPLLGAPRSKVSEGYFQHPAPFSSHNEQRFVLITEGDKVTHVTVEPNPGQVTICAADKILPLV